MNKPAYSRFTPVILSVFILIIMPASAVAQAPQDAPPEWCIPPAARLAAALGVDCDDLLALHAEGVGWGEMMVAHRLAQAFSDAGDWEDLLDAHQERQGWGEMMMAGRLGAAWDLDPDELLAHKRAGLGWGQIRHAQALVDAGRAETLGEAADLLRGDADWEDLHEGPPPWAGRPAWAGGPHREGRQDDDARGGPPPWAAGRGNR